MAGFDPNQPRNEDGEWTEAENAARKAAGLSSDGNIFSKPLFADFEKQGREDYVNRYVKRMSEFVETNLDIRIMTNEEFTSFIADKARKMGLSPSEVKMFYDRAGNFIGVKKITISSITDPTEFRLFMQTLDHEIAHGVWFQVLKKLPEKLTRDYNYYASVSEEFADVFSARIGVLRRLQQKGKALPSDIKKYLFEDTLLAMGGS